MAVGGSHHNHNHKGVNNGNRSGAGKPYGLMLLLVFGAALLGVMVLHKLRERRIFSLLVKEKDTQLISIQLILQKEREYGKEMKRKSEEMKVTIYSLKTQKMALDRRIIELQSTIDSLKDEQKVMESALEEKQNEMKIQREDIDSRKDNSKLVVLREILRQKEAEIEDLRRHLEYPTKVWSVLTDDPSHAPINLTDTSSVAEEDKTDTSLSEEKGGELHESTNFIDGENSARVGDRGEKSVGDTNSMEMIVDHLHKPKISHDEGFKSGGAGEEGIDEAEVIANSTKTIVDASGNVQKLRANNSDVKDGIEHTITREWELGKLQYFQEGEKQEVQVIDKGGKKLEMLDSSINVGSRLRGKHDHISRTKGKKGWRALAKNRVSVNDGLASIRSRRFYRLDQDELRSKRDSQAYNRENEKSEGKSTSENPVALQETVVSMDAKFLKENPEDAQYMKIRAEKVDPNPHVHQENEILKKFYNPPDREAPGNTCFNHVDNILGDAEKKRPDKVRQLEEEASDISQDNYVQGSMAKQVKDSDKLKIAHNMKATDMHASEIETTNGDSFRGFTSNLEDNREEYKDTLDESGFQAFS